MNPILFLLVPLIGYIGLWVLASPLFILYFKVFKVAVDLKQTVHMIQQLPALLAIVTVPICSLVSFFITMKVAVQLLSPHPSTSQAWQLGGVSLGVTIILDLLITVVGERIDVRQYPVNLMYLLAWLVIVPAVVAAR